jgi:hypothetical protein
MESRWRILCRSPRAYRRGDRRTPGRLDGYRLEHNHRNHHLEYGDGNIDSDTSRDSDSSVNPDANRDSATHCYYDGYSNADIHTGE